jgi:hypothetical protein
VKRFRSKKVLAVVVAGAITLGGAGAALAYFTSSGSGSGSATVGTAGAWSVTQTGDVGPALLPDSVTPPVLGTNVDTISYDVKNLGSGTQDLSQVVVSIANSDGSAWTSVSGCSASDFSIAGGAVGASFTDTSLAGEVTAGSTTSAASFTLEMIDNPTASQDGCKLATVPLYYSAS